jgi:cytochrome c553
VFAIGALGVVGCGGDQDVAPSATVAPQSDLIGLRRGLVGAWTYSTDEEAIRLNLRQRLRPKSMPGDKLAATIDKQLLVATAEVRELAERWKLVFRSDGALLEVDTYADGRPKPARASRATWNVEKRDGQLLIVVTRNNFFTGTTRVETMRFDSLESGVLHVSDVEGEKVFGTTIFVRTDVDESLLVTADERLDEAWRLRQQRPDERIAELKSYFTNTARARQFNLQPDQAIHAIVGVDLQIRRRVAKEFVWPSLDTPPSSREVRLAIANLGTRLYLTRESPKLAALDPRGLLRALADTDDPIDAAMRAGELVDVVRFATPQILPRYATAAGEVTPRSDAAREGVLQVLDAIGRRFSVEQLGNSRTALRAIEHYLGSFANNPSPVISKELLKATLARLSPDEAKRAADRILSIAERTKQSKPKLAEILLATLKSIKGGLSPEQSARAREAGLPDDADPPENENANVEAATESEPQEKLKFLAAAIECESSPPRGKLVQACQSDPDPVKAATLAMWLAKCHEIDGDEIVMLLDSPNCVGLPRYYLLSELEKRTQQRFNGNVWEAVRSVEK